MLNQQNLRVRAAFLAAIRTFFLKEDFLAVDTPIRQPVLIPEATIEPIEANGQYLQSSPEQCMKLLLAQGIDRIYQICPCFRKNEKGRKHLEEFTMLEWYRRQESYIKLMADCQALVRFVCNELWKDDFLSQGKINSSYLQFDWQKITVAEAFARWSPVPLKIAMKDYLFDEIIVEQIEPNLGLNSPTFLYDYPAEMASLAKLKSGDNSVAERFELYMYGVELANGFSELTDGKEQRERFVLECKLIEDEGNRTAKIPERFLNDLDKIGEATGIALGLDRLLMLLMNKKDINDVVSINVADFY
ncbi:MAG: EF-P lysine aminoacylase EpmA [Desulfotalea sp.]